MILPYKNAIVMLSALLAAFLVLATTPALAGWQDFLKPSGGSSSSSSSSSSTPVATPSTTSSGSSSSGAVGANLSDSQVNSGLSDMLGVAVKRSISQVGQDGGYLNNPEIKIPLPGSLQTVEKGLRLVGKGEMADEFVASMNHAAEQAVPETTDIFMETIQNMTMEDARGILNGGDDSATRFFEKNAHDPLQKRILPIVKETTDANQVTAKYKAMVGEAQTAAPLVSSSIGTNADLDQYVTDKALDGLFTVMAEEEKKIRENPAARATDLLKQMFGN